MSLTLSKRHKEEIFKIILSSKDPFVYKEREGYLPFLRTIWDLDQMPSEDDRFKNAEGDIIQHTLNNDDWDIEYLFIERLKLFENDNTFIKFIEAVISPEFRDNEDEILTLTLPINDILLKNKLQLSLVDYSPNELPIYQIQEVDFNDPFPSDIKKNTIPFFVNLKPSGHHDRVRSHKKPEEFPAFVLVFNASWNDYTFRTDFRLFFYDTQEVYHDLGDVKIMTLEEKTEDVIPAKFYNLDSRFCSLGQEFEYYQELKEFLGKDFIGVLYALKDVAFFSEIQEEFENSDKFKNSLIRYNETERLLREAKHRINGADLKNLYSFTYQFTPKFSEDYINVDFNFGEVGELPNRVYALIGKNGTGKTQLISQLPLDISEKKSENFLGNMPIFSKVIAVSYSVFDNFEIPKKTATFNYVYCGLRKDEEELKSEQSLVLNFHNSWKKILSLERINEWRNILLTFIDVELIDQFILRKSRHEWEVSLAGYHKIKDKLSSGQGIMLYMISQIVANIRFDSLILFDEPETHLHPNAISQLMNTIYSLVEAFESYCIIATHSPLVVRECFSRNVYIVERHENVPSIRRIGRECFGENLSVITEEVFGNKDVTKHYKTVIENLVGQGKNMDEIIELIERDGVPLSLNARVYIKSLIPNQNA